jgi:uncharacterized membrane protein (DUF4010 family)
VPGQPYPLDELLGIIVGALGGAAVGLEREWSGHARGPEARFAGLRTFTLIGGLGGLGGWMWGRGLGPPALVVAAGCAGLIITAYAAAARRHIDATTEMAALIVLSAGLMAGAGYLALASGTVALTALLLIEKTRLHGLVARIDDESLRAGLRFAVMAMVVLPLLPAGPYGPYGAIRPRELWLLVLFFSGLSFLGYIARRAVGETHGDVVAGLLGGIVSSTSVTLTFARASRSTEGGASLGAGAVAACTVMFGRVVLAVAVLHPPLARAVVPYVALPFMVGIAAIVAGLRLRDPGTAAPATSRNPLALAAALQMAVLFQFVLIGIHIVRDVWGTGGMLVSGALVGLTDMDALTLSMSRQASAGLDLDTAARATAVGTVANGVLKLLIAVALGRRGFRVVAGLGIAAIVAAGLVALFVW